MEKRQKKTKKGKFALKDLDLDKAKGGLEKDEGPRCGTGPAGAAPGGDKVLVGNITSDSFHRGFTKGCGSTNDNIRK